MIGIWEPTPVSRQLDAFRKMMTDSAEKETVKAVRGALRKFVSTVMQPSSWFILQSKSKAKNNDWKEQVWELITSRWKDYGNITTDWTMVEPTRAIVFGRSLALDRWIVIFSREFPCSRREFNTAVSSVLHSGDTTDWCVVWGSIPEGERTVVSLFSHRWMVYDRYGQFAFDTTTVGQQASVPSLEPVAAASHQVGSVEGPAPNTIYKEGKGDPKTLIEGVDEISLTPDALRYYQTLYDKRREVADEVRADAGECEFQLGQSLRLTWVSSQRADKLLMPMFGAKNLDSGYRVAKDGLLERQVQLPPPVNSTWVPIVPNGQATGNLSWKRWLFLQCHVGILGAHRNAEKTTGLLSRQVWWLTMKSDVAVWTEGCITCLRFRKTPQRQEAVPTIPTNCECWEEVMIDLEGPSNPSSKNGHKYTMTYICVLCHGVLLEGSARITAADTRRMFACCIMRSWYPAYPC